MQLCPPLQDYPGDNEADSLAAYTGALIVQYSQCALRHDALVEHVRKSNVP